MSRIERKSCDGTMRFCAYEGDQKVGYAYAFTKNGGVKIGYIENSNGHGGVGSMLLEAIIEWASQEGAACVLGNLCPQPGSEAAVLRLMEKFGFEVDHGKADVVKRLE